MQRKTLLSACIALALSGQGWAADITEIETTTGEKKNTNVTCPADPGKLSPEELKRLPSECSSVVEQNLMPWLVTGAATALITTLAIVELNDDDDHHRNNSPLPPTPPDDDSDDTPVPPTPGGDEIIPDDGPDDTPTPPKPISFNNDVILDKTEKTLTIRDSVFTYTENADGTISLQDSNGRKATINLWQIDETNNTVALEGMSADGATKWQYNHNGELVITGDNTTVNNTGKTIVDGKGATGTEIAGNNAVVNQDGELDVSGGGHGIDITGDSATVDNKGGMTVTDPDSIGIQIDGDKAVVNNDGDSAISNGGTGTQVNGDEATVNNNGSTTVDGKDSTGTEINGDKAIVNNDGDNTILDGGTGTRITGDDATANNSGNTTVDGQGSTGTEIAGNNAVVNQDGELDVSGGGHGIDITGDSATVDNKGGMTVTDPDSIGIQIDGDKAVVNNDGDSAVSNGGTGTQVNGDEATVNNNGSTTVDGKDSTGTEINGDKAIVNNDGDSTILDGGTGTRITGDDATANNSGNTTVDGQGSTGTEIAGNNAVVNQDGELDVSGGGHGIDITGDSATVDNKGGMTVTDPDSIGIQIDGDKAVVNNDGDNAISNGGTGTQVNGDEATVNNNGSTTVDGQGSTGTEIAGNNAVVNQDGELDVSGGGHGIDITGDSATVDNKGGMTVTDPDSIGIQIDGDKAVVNNDGDNAISNGGTGTQVNGDEATVNNNGNTTVDGKDSTGTEINGDKAIVNNDGDSTILDGGTGTRITGDDATANNSGNTTVDGQGSTGTEIAGNNAVVNQDGELDVSGGGHGIDITGDSATVDNKGGMTVADADSIGIQIDGDKAVVNNDGDNAISNGGTGTQVNGDEATVNNNGSTTVDGKDSTGTEINGDKAIVNNDGDSTILDGGTGTRITGDDATANNSGNTTVDGQGSTGTEIAGNNAVVNQDGELDVSGGGHGIDITGDSATVDNKGGMTVTDPDSIGIQIDGDKAVVNNDGDSAISNGGTGTQVNGDEATVNNNGKTTVDGQGSTGTEIAGNNAVVNQDGELDVSGGGHGVDITGDSATVDNKGGMTVTDPDSIGIQIDGDKAVVNNDGDSAISNGGTGTQVNGDEATVNNNGKTTVDGQGSIGTEIAGNNAVVNQDGTLDVSGGGHGIDITGDSATVDNKGGMTVTDPDSIGIQIDGDKAVVNNDGDSAISNGGTGTQVNGDEATVNNNGKTTVDGKDSTGTEINGDKAIVNNDGDSTILDGGTGTRITGDDATANNSGNTTVDGQGSTGTEIAGNNAVVNQDGLLDVSGGGHGIDITGDSATVINKGNITVTDKDSVGVLINGDRATFANTGHIDVNNSATGFSIATSEGVISLTGSMDVGDISTGMVLSGDGNSVTLAVEDLNVTGQKAMGVDISGDSNDIDIAGNILVDKDQTADNAADYFFESSVGVNVTGNNNTVSLNGELTVVSDSELTSRSHGKRDGSQENISGLIVSGDNNTISLNGGIQFIGEQKILADGSDIASLRKGFSDTSIISVDGNSSVYLNGTSTIGGDLPLGYTSIIQLKNKAILEIGRDALLGVKDIKSFNNYYEPVPKIIKATTGSKVINNGNIDIQNIGFISVSGEDTSGTNNGNITLSQYDYGNMMSGTNALLSTDGGSVVNNGTIIGKVMEQSSVINRFETTDVTYDELFNNSVTGITGMLSKTGAMGINNVNGIIDMYGRGSVGMLAVTQAIIENAGTIKLDSLWVDANDTTALPDNIAISNARYYGAGMAVGSDSYGSPDANVTAINQLGGVISVYNAGVGMAAYGGSNMVINQGTINLEKNENYSSSLSANTLVGMAVYQHGTAINDKTGVININVDTGQAFYNDGTGTILNYGEINLLGSPMDSADPHMGATPDNLDLLSALTGSGETDMRTASSGGFVTTKALANYGNETLNSNVTAKAWLYNQDKANLTINGELSVGQGLENSGLLDSDTISAAANVYNRASGSIITDLLMLTSGNSFFNEGNFSGSIVGNSYRQNVVNTGSMTVTADGTSLIGGSFVLYNEAGAILSNSNSAVSGGENAIVNITRTSDSLAQVNRGTITATNGYSAIKTASTGSNSNGKWIWNTDTGVISGVNPNAPLIDLGRGYNFANAGTINVQGDGAVAISGGTTSYTVQLVNSGTINVGTAQGKADGTNGTGLIGIKGNGRETTINNAQSGVINVYADNSWAFGGQTKTIINNGEINLLCDMGCDIYAPGTTGTLNDHNSTTDIIVPAATSTPTQGSVPTVPADSSAQQKLTNYTIGTNSDGTSGMLKANNLVISDNVKVNTGFSAGTADTTVVINDVFKGENISGAENISSSTVMWNAQGSTDASGNVDVTMTKNAYTDVVTDSSVNNVAQVLDTGYTNNDLYTSLNVGTTAELNSALKQISGSQATTVFNEARVLSNRFSMLSDAAPEVANGLAFNVVAKGDPRAELGNDTQYDMMALRKSLTLTEHQNLSLEYGIARLEGNGSDTAGDNGVTGGYSQFFGLKHQMAFDNGMSWNNALRYDVHNLDSSRSIAYGDVNKTADANVKQQYLEFRSEGAKTFELREGLNVTPYAGVKLRHTLEGGYQERNAGDFNLSMNSGSETAVDSIVGLKLDYAGKEGWSANATLEGGPNLSYVKSQRTASISGAGSQRFNIDDGQNGGGFNSLATMGVKYSSQESALQVDAFHWKEDGISDKGVMLNFKKTF
ncbi:TPA: beta strand repeat-containing protein [Escherichia coli]|uniref:beta strand repeat-containing protein n=3 Tax=Escherichia coli TaxID=562 RepID=UPI0010CB7358|nr:EntS/YbdA MFS transporter [Escherichia coli]EEU9140048.1 EntS/YbdA MFS transporter [Escherichia coli]EFA7599179.1 EntS/YbdA MFS transporter [Escherichia coli]EFB1683285.1 EntS/YbdA MFS transporter [Escherichia coli]EFC9744991.1 EntS/YbdA MFS transporter [Escherichia coli]EFN4278109.1 EntS/YbdA MFS transporter [Escherichia coli]